MGTMVDKLYQLDYEALCSQQSSVATSQLVSIIDNWHYRLGHANEQCIKSIAYKKLQLVSGYQSMLSCHSVKVVLLER